MRHPHLPLLAAALLLAAACSSAPPPPAAPPAPAPLAVAPPPAPVTDIGEAEPPCPPTRNPVCDVYLRAAAECIPHVPPDRRPALREIRNRLCKAWQVPTPRPYSPRSLTAQAALMALFDEPACQLSATTALVTLNPPREPWCEAKPPRPLEPDPAGPVQITVQSEPLAPLHVRTVIVAVDGIGVFARSLLPGDKMDALTLGTLGTLRGRLPPGDHTVRIFLALSPRDGDPPRPPDIPPNMVHGERCLTVRDGVPLTVTVTVNDARGRVRARIEER